MVGDDYKFPIACSNKRNSLVDPVDGTMAKDPVYRKISKATKYAHRAGYDDPYWPISGAVQERVNDLQMELENRTMDAPTYRHLLKTSMKNLLAEWARETREVSVA